nr:zona pellucida sperm-binding protein 3-like [Saimiri boliviensis boliviensis]
MYRTLPPLTASGPCLCGNRALAFVGTGPLLRAVTALHHRSSQREAQNAGETTKLSLKREIYVEEELYCEIHININQLLTCRKVKENFENIEHIHSGKNMIYITCHLKVILAEQDPDELNKACSFSKSSNSWFPVEGPADIYQCCSKGDCGTPSHARRQPHVVSLGSSSSVCNHRHVTEEADVSVGLLIFLDRTGDHEMEQWALPADTSLLLLGTGLALVAFLTLTAVILVVTRRCHTASHPVSASQ